MILYFNKNGQLLEQLEYGAAPRVGMTRFDIFAYFDGINPESYGAAIIRFRRPDLEGSEYPNLFMVSAAGFVFDSSIEESHYFVNGQSYRGYAFIFDKVRDDITQEVITMLDTPGMWEASIVLVNSSQGRNVMGMVKFPVAGSVSDADEDIQTLSYDVISANIADVVSTKVDKSDSLYLRYSSDFVAQAEEGTLLKRAFVVGTDVFDQKTLSIFHIEAVEDNPSLTDDEYVYVTQYSSINMIYFSGYVRELVNDVYGLTIASVYGQLQGGNFCVLNYGGNKYFCFFNYLGENLFNINIWNNSTVWFNSRISGNFTFYEAFAEYLSSKNYVFNTDLEFVSYNSSQNLNAEQKALARSNIGAGDGDYNNLTNKPDLKAVATSGSYSDLVGTPSIPAKTSQLTNDGDGSSPFTTKSYVDSAVSGATQFKGTVATASSLPSSGNVQGDMYWVTDEAVYYIWNGSQWAETGGQTDLSGYYTKTESDARYLQSQTWRKIQVGGADVIADNSSAALNFDNSSTGLGDVTFSYDAVSNPSRLKAHADVSGVATTTWVESQGYISTLGSILPVKFRNVTYDTTLNTLREWLGNPVAESYVSFILDKPKKNNVAQPGAYLITMVYHASGSKYDLTIDVLGMKNQAHYVVMDKLGTVTLGDILDNDLGQYKKEYVDSSGALILLYDNVKIGSSEQPYNAIYLYNQDTQSYDSISGGEDGGDYAFPSISTNFAVRGDLYVQGDFYCYDDATINYTVSDGNTDTDVILTLPLASGRLATQEWVVESYVSLGTTQTITGDKSFKSSLSADKEIRITTSNALIESQYTTGYQYASFDFTGFYVRHYHTPSTGYKFTASGFEYYVSDVLAATFNLPTGSNQDTYTIATQEWVNSQGFLTSHQSLANYVTLNTAQTISGAKTFTASNTFQGNNSFDGITSFTNNNNHSMVSISKDTTVAMYFYTYNSTSQTVNTHFYSLGFENAAPSADRALQLPNESGILATRTWVQNQGYLTSVDWTDVGNRPTDLGDFTNNAGFITGINSTMVTTALGYTPPSTDTLNTCGSKNKTNTKLWIVGRTAQSSVGEESFSNSNCYIGTDNCLYSDGNKVLTSYTDTNYYLTEGTWSGMTYSFTANGGNPAVSFTIPHDSTKQDALTTSSVSDGSLNKVIGFDTNGNVVKSSIGTSTGGWNYLDIAYTGENIFNNYANIIRAYYIASDGTRYDCDLRCGNISGSGQTSVLVIGSYEDFTLRINIGSGLNIDVTKFKYSTNGCQVMNASYSSGSNQLVLSCRAFTSGVQQVSCYYNAYAFYYDNSGTRTEVPDNDTIRIYY